jgi:hypothetical protein
MKSYYLKVVLDKGSGAIYTSTPRRFTDEEKYLKELKHVADLLEQLPDLATLHIETYAGNTIFFPRAVLAECIVEIVTSPDG